VGLPILGVVLVFAAILVPTISLNLRLQIAVVVLGLLAIEAGVWKLTARILPNERKYIALREEVDEFIALVRTLNRQAVEGGVRPEDGTPPADLAETLRRMHASVDRMAELAGEEG